jgi:predicted nucleotidyltransferase
MVSWLNLCLYPELRLKVIGHFIKNPNLRQNQTQLARSIGVPQNSLGRYISGLVALRVLNEEQYGKSVVYSLNRDSILVNRLLNPIITLSQNLLANWVEEQMNALHPGIKKVVEEVILFGSGARGELRDTSDIDLLAIVSRNFDNLEFELNSALVANGNKVGLNVNLQIELRSHYNTAINRKYLKFVKSEGIILWTGRQDATSLLIASAET